MLDALDKLDDILMRTPSSTKEAVAQDEESHDVMVSHPDEEDAEEAVTQNVQLAVRGEGREEQHY